MRYQPTSIAVCLALGLMSPACGESPEDPLGAPWAPPEGENEDDDDAADESGGADDGASSWGDGGDPDTWGETSAGDDSAGDDASGEGGDDSAGDDSAGDDSAGDDSAGGETSGGSGSQSPYTGGWDVGDCDSASGPGETIVGIDQHGDVVFLRDFCHKAVLFVLGNFT